MDPSDGAGADERVELVDEEDDRALGLLDLLQDGLQAVLELAAVLGAGDHGAEVERDDALVLQALGHVAHVDAAGEALDDRGLADAGLADQDRVVLRAAGEHLDHAADLLVAPDDGVDLAAAGEVRQVARVALQGLVLVLRVRIGDPRGAAHFLERLQQDVLLDARLGEPLRRVAARLGQGHQEVLGRDVLVAEFLGDLEGAVEDARQLAREHRVGRGARDLGAAVELGLDLAGERVGVGAELLENGDDDAVVLLEQGEQEVVAGQLRVAAGARVALGFLECLLGLDGELVQTHAVPSRRVVIRDGSGGDRPGLEAED